MGEPKKSQYEDNAKIAFVYIKILKNIFKHFLLKNIN